MNQALSPAQRQQTEAVFLGDTETSASLAAIEAAVGEDRQCPHCGTPGAISRGKARGLRRYQCKECRKTFNAATGTPLSGLHRKDKWLSFGACLADGLTVRASAERCGLAVNTALRWRHRFLAGKDLKARKLTGIVEADEKTYVLESRKGARNLERKARRRGGKASKRGLSDEQVPVLVVADRSGATVSAVLPAVNADTLREVIAPVVDEDIVWLSLQAVCVHVMFFVKSEGWIDMDHKQFQEWLSGIDHLSPAQRQQTEAVFLGDTETSASLAAIEAAVGEDRQCPHCGTPGAISRGKARGLRRYQCKECRKTFNAATGTPLSGLHRKDKWLSFGACLADGLTVRASAERCGLAVNTALRWRHRFLAAKDLKARKLTGIVEADETYVLESRKGARNLERKARRRGGKASKRGLSDEQVPVLVVADRSGATVSAVLPAVNADTLREVIAPVVDEDIVLVTDGHRACPRCAAAIGAHHEALNLSRSERVRGAFHIQIAADPAVNNRHSRLKDFLRRYRGVATRYLDNYLRWFQRLELENASPRACLATAIACPCIQFVN